LINAYRTAASDAIANNQIIEQYEQDRFTIKFDYAAMNDVMRVLKDENPQQSNQQFDNQCSIDISIRKTQGDALRQKLTKIEGVVIG
jgi:putative IMPACT (imprinted ancient) family translation regulator